MEVASYQDTAKQAEELDAASHTSSGGTSTSTVQDLARTALNSAVTEAKAIAADGYTEASYKALTDAITAAEELAKNPDTGKTSKVYGKWSNVKKVKIKK